MSEDPIVALKGQVEALEWQRNQLVENVHTARSEVAWLRRFIEAKGGLTAYEVWRKMHERSKPAK